jgi:NAD(P)-dependent dehydrogenase (short-subunit alcohol dehydrogenase family)
VILDTNVCNREAVGQRCDVTDWDSQLALFEFGISTFGAIDVVVCPAPTEVDDDRNDPLFLHRLRTLVSTKPVPSTSLKW